MWICKAHIAANLSSYKRLILFSYIIFYSSLCSVVTTHSKHQRELFLKFIREFCWVTNCSRLLYVKGELCWRQLKMNVTQNSSAGNGTVLSEEPAQLNSDDATWILTSAFIIFTMQSGFGLVESGLYNLFASFLIKFPVLTTRAKLHVTSLQNQQYVEWWRLWYLVYKN